MLDLYCIYKFVQTEMHARKLSFEIISDETEFERYIKDNEKLYTNCFRCEDKSNEILSKQIVNNVVDCWKRNASCCFSVSILPKAYYGIDGKMLCCGFICRYF